MKVCFRICVFLSCIASCSTQTPVIVRTNVGNITGFKEYVPVDGEQKLITKFLGIPFAESTTGSNRFRKPIPKAPFQSTFDAKKVPLACYQQSIQEADIYKNNYGVPGFSEDCLTLDVFVPHVFQSREMLPVMIWIYGGGFTQGASAIYNPEVLAVFGNVIVVTINYRVGMFGFLRDRNGKFPGNQGLWDQHLAIKWVNNNIDKFFGYKDEITIFGESAGGASVLLQAIHPGNKGLFKRVIAQSGTANSPWAIKDISSFDVYLTEQGCMSDMGTFETCLQSKDPAALQSNITTFGPVVDGEFLVDTPKEIIHGKSAETAEARDFFASLDVIVGVNNLDGAGYFPYLASMFGYSNQNFNVTKNDLREQIIPFFVDINLFPKNNDTRTAYEKVLTFVYTNWNDPDNYIDIRSGVLDMANDAILFAPSVQTADAHSALRQGNTYFYEFAVQVRNHIDSVPQWLNGSNHGDELLFVLGLTLQKNITAFGSVVINSTPEEEQIARAVMAMWSNFAKSGNPNVPMNVTQIIGTSWPKYTMTSRRYFQISNQMSPASVKEGFHPRRMAFWSDVIPLIPKDKNCQQPDIVHFDPSVDLVG